MFRRSVQSLRYVNVCRTAPGKMLNFRFFSSTGQINPKSNSRSTNLPFLVFSALGAIAVSSYILTKQQKSRPQFQESDAANTILPRIKEKDVDALFSLIKDKIAAKITQAKFTNKSQDFVITDIGAGEGEMLLSLLNKMASEFEDYKRLDIKIYVCEPSIVLINKLIDNFQKQYSYLKNVQIVAIENCKMEEYKLIPSDIILSSHSLYYARPLWDSVKFNGPKDYTQNIIYQWLMMLKPDGSLAIILQSGEPTGIFGEKGKELANHEKFEDVFYPILFQHNGDEIKLTVNSDRSTFANAELFEYCAKNLVQDLENKLQLKISISKANSVVEINLGKLNFGPNEKGQYEQQVEVLKLLDFYTRKTYSKLTPGQQCTLLTHLFQNNTTTNDQQAMVHVNSAIVMSPEPSNKILRQ